jgi:2-methylcitrate dehydratase PrpD
MMLKGNVTLRDYTEEGLRDPRVLAMADRVVYREDAGAELPVGGNSTLSRPTVEIRLKDGRVVSHKAEGVPGDPKNPVTLDMIETKFRDCVSFSAQAIPAANVDRAIALVRDLEQVEDVSEIMRLLSPDT